VAAATRVAADAAVVLVGASAGGVISGLVIFSAFGAMSGSILGAPRVYFAMARDGLLFRWVSEVHPRYRTPHRAIMLQGVRNTRKTRRRTRNVRSKRPAFVRAAVSM